MQRSRTTAPRCQERQHLYVNPAHSGVWAHHGLMDDHEGGEDGGAAARQGSVQPLAVDDIHEDAAPEHGAENGAEAKEVDAGSVLAGVVARLEVVAPSQFSE